MKKIFLASLLLISACVNQQHAAIKPEALINSSSEKISFPLSDSASVIAVEEWVNNGSDLPTGAEISCKDENPSCLKIKTFLTNKKISFNETPTLDAKKGSVSLSYNRVIARSCNISSFGCASALNAIHMVTNREQFVKPALSDYQDAAQGVMAVKEYLR